MCEPMTVSSNSIELLRSTGLTQIKGLLQSIWNSSNERIAEESDGFNVGQICKGTGQRSVKRVDKKI